MDITSPDWLSEDATKIYNTTLPKIKEVTPEKLRMLAAFAHCAAEFHRASIGDGGSVLRSASGQSVPNLWRRGMLFARNGLGIAPPVHESFCELLLDDGWPEYDSQGQFVCLHGGKVTHRLNPAWQFGEDLAR